MFFFKGPWYIFHKSFLPGMISVCLVALFSSLLVWFKFGYLFILFLVIIFFLSVIVLWSETVILEALSGHHSFFVVELLKLSFLWFIFTEIMFFFSIFWVFFDAALSPSVELGGSWVPIGIIPINPFGVPFLNSMVLLSSAVSVTWSHHSILSSKSGLMSLFVTIFLGFYFIFLQFGEYKEAEFTMSDSIYGSIFFMATGFHGAHVSFGTILLALNFFRMKKNHFSSQHHLGYECSIIYWHFVDVVWLGLYLMIYWWSY